MIVAFPISLNDQDLALKNVQWWNELGGCRGHDCLFVADSRCQQASAVMEELKKCFDNVYNFPARAEINGWPEGANYMFRTVTAWMGNTPKWKYFMWMEPDAIPLKRGWLNGIEAEYKLCGKPFMGDRVQVENIPLHMSGVGVYPNPLHAYAGEAYRAQDIAWDMAGREQIIPQAHFTKLIEHAWKHPSFKDESELSTQIRPEAILFHASKDGSLITLLQGKQRGKQLASNMAQPETQKEPDKPGSPSLITSAKAPGGTKSSMASASGGATCDIFIRTYPGDYPWLEYCLQSISKFCSGFRKLWIITPQVNPQPEGSLLLADGSLLPVQWKQMNDETEDGYLAQQITKLYADVITDYQPDYILHVDSDVIFTKPTTPGDFMEDGKVVWLMTPYKDIETPWQPVTEKFMGEPVEFEFMRRFPIMVPRWVYPRVREFCHIRHDMILSNYVQMQPHRAFSEFNVLGAYCYKYHHDKFHFQNTLFRDLPVESAKQFHSWSGITPEVKKELNAIFGVDGGASQPTAGAGETATGGSSSLPPGVKELKNGLWVIEGDTHISKWIEQQDRLDHDQNSLPFILPLIKEGDVVVDAGAFVGDHTIAYSKAVGKTGIVHAFEPNPVAYQCLMHNLRGCSNVICHDVGLSNVSGSVPLSGNNNNHGGCYIGEHMKLADVPVQSLDEWFYCAKIDLIKFDIEGSEVEALIGAQKLIERCHPTMVIEVNQVALERQGNTVGQLFAILESHGYEWKIMQENCCATDPMYDIICAHTPPEVFDRGKGERGFTRCSSEPPPVATFSAREQIQQHIERLKGFAESSPQNKAHVMQLLVYAGLRNPRKKKKNETTHQVKTNIPCGSSTGVASKKSTAQGKGKHPGRNHKRPGLVSAQGPEKGEA